MKDLKQMVDQKLLDVIETPRDRLSYLAIDEGDPNVGCMYYEGLRLIGILNQCYTANLIAHYRGKLEFYSSEDHQSAYDVLTGIAKTIPSRVSILELLKKRKYNSLTELEKDEISLFINRASFNGADHNVQSFLNLGKKFQLFVYVFYNLFDDRYKEVNRKLRRSMHLFGELLGQNVLVITTFPSPYFCPELYEHDNFAQWFDYYIYSQLELMETFGLGHEDCPAIVYSPHFSEPLVGKRPESKETVVFSFRGTNPKSVEALFEYLLKVSRKERVNWWDKQQFNAAKFYEFLKTHSKELHESAKTMINLF